MVSLYNNNLNGILADEMGLGKTIQVSNPPPLLFAVFQLIFVTDDFSDHVSNGSKAK